MLLSSCSATKDQVALSNYPFRMDNLIPWSIVAFDNQERGPSERVKMIKHLGFSQYAFGGREKHLLTMKKEWQLAREQDVRISAVWLYLNHKKDKPGQLKPMSESIFKAIKEVGLETQIWVGFHPEYFKDLPQEAAIGKCKEMVSYLAKRADSLQCKIALYNHGGWFGEPENQLEIIQALPEYDIGLIYNFHHGHEHLDRYPQIVEMIMPYLWCVSLNGMKQEGPKIISIGKGKLEKEMIGILLRKGFKGPFSILGHVKGGDAELILKENLVGLQTLFPKNSKY